MEAGYIDIELLPSKTRWEKIIILGVLILVTRYELSSRRDLWYSRSWCKYIGTPGIVKTGLTRQRFDHLWSFIRFSIQQKPRPEGINMKEWECQLVNDHIEKFNSHILENLSPSDRLCVYESFRRWCGLGGDWINLSM